MQSSYTCAYLDPESLRTPLKRPQVAGDTIIMSINLQGGTLACRPGQRLAPQQSFSVAFLSLRAPGCQRPLDCPPWPWRQEDGSAPRWNPSDGAGAPVTQHIPTCTAQPEIDHHMGESHMAIAIPCERQKFTRENFCRANS